MRFMARLLQCFGDGNTASGSPGTRCLSRRVGNFSAPRRYANLLRQHHLSVVDRAVMRRLWHTCYNLHVVRPSLPFTSVSWANRGSALRSRHHQEMFPPRVKAWLGLAATYRL